MTTDTDTTPLDRRVIAATRPRLPWAYDASSEASPLEQRDYAVRLVLLEMAPDYFGPARLPLVGTEEAL